MSSVHGVRPSFRSGVVTVGRDNADGDAVSLENGFGQHEAVVAAGVAVGPAARHVTRSLW